MTTPEAKKVVTSVLLNLIIAEQDHDAFLTHCDQVVKNGLELPEPTFTPVADDASHIKCSINLTPAIDEQVPYEEAIGALLEKNLPIICAMANYDHSIPVQLSALVSVDRDLAVFDLKTPRFPPRLAQLGNFQFHY
jgi:hypothetical protein